MKLAKSERAELCDLLEYKGPDQPTLCEGWTTHDLAAHLWVRETDILGAPGIVVKPLAGVTERRMNETKSRWSFAELVDRLRQGPARLSIFAIPGVDDEASSVEFFVHHEDVRRAGDDPLPPRTLPDDVEDWLWRRLKLMGRAMFRNCPVGVVLEREDSPSAATTPARAAAPSPGEPDIIRAHPGSDIVTVLGKPSELLLFAEGRKSAARVRMIGSDAGKAKLAAADLTK